MAQEKIIAVGLLTQRDLAVLGAGFRRAFPIEQCGDFDSLLRAIDEADGSLRKSGGRAENGSGTRLA